MPGYRPWAGTGARSWFRLVIILAGSLEALAFREYLGPDAISYLDIADAWVRVDGGAALNSYWSPAWSWLLAGLAVLPLSGRAEIVAVHVLLLATLLFSLRSFEHLLTRIDRPLEEAPGPVGWFGYGLFGWTAVVLTGLVWSTPDLLLLGVICLAAAAGLDFVRAPATAGPRQGARFGLLLGIGYLVKAIMLPVAVIWLGVTAVLLERGRRRRVIGLIVVLLAVAGPWIAVLSIREGSATTGSAGRLNTAWFLGGVKPFTHWEGSDRMPPVTPIGKTGPAAYGFPQPFEHATYPPWYAPAYWYEGAEPDFTWDRATGNVAANLRRLALLPGAPLLPAAFLLMGLAARSVRRPEPGDAFLFLPACAALGAYVLLTIEGRLAAPFLLLGGLGLATWASGMRGPDKAPDERRWLSPLGAGRAAGLLFLVLVAVDGARAAGWLLWTEPPGRNRDVAIAEEIHRLGLEPGTRIAVVGDGSAAGWARIGRLRIVADMPDVDGFLALTPTERAGIFEFFRSVGARAVVVEPRFGDVTLRDRARSDLTGDWKRLGGDRAYARRLSLSGRTPVGERGAEPRARREE